MRKFISITIMALLSLGGPAWAEGLPGLSNMRFLWPSDPAAPGGEMLELRGEIGDQYRSSTPLGEVEALPVAWKTASGKQVAETVIYFLPAGGGVRSYVFETKTLEDVTAATGEFGRPHFALPAFTAPDGYNRVLNYREDAFSPPSFEPVPSMGPTVMYTDELDAVIISSLDRFLSTVQAPVDGEWWCGFAGEVEKIPAGTIYTFLMVQGRGINYTMMKWGDVVMNWHGHQRQDLYADVGLAYLGYWTDNGGYYYYKTAPGMDYHQTLTAVKTEADRLDIPYGYFQIDSWWYPKAKTNNLMSMATGGAIAWEAMPEVFPRGVAAFQDELGLPLIAHNRWYDRTSPYCERYECVYGEGVRSAALPIDPAFWDEIMDNAVSYGVEVYEQDWLATQLYMIPWLRQGIDHAERWFDAMVGKAHERGLTVQLCMASPGFALQQVKHPNVTQMRTSGDYQAALPKTRFWPAFHTSSMFAWSVGLLPFKDNFQSSPGQRFLRSERWPYEETLVSILSAGLVGPADKLGHADKELLMRTCRDDGLLLKPDRPATPIDLMFLDTKKPWTVITWSSHQIGDTGYLASFNIQPWKTTDHAITMAQLGIAGPRAVYNYRTGEFLPVVHGIDMGRMPYNQASYYILCPMLENGMALIGETDKFVTLSRKRFPGVRVDNGRLEIEVLGLPGETVEILLHAPGEIEATGCRLAGSRPAEGGKLHVFSLVVPDNGSTTVSVINK